MIRRKASSRKHRLKSNAALEMTAFMNLMVNLIPFLLITAVFSKLSILDLYLPSASPDINTENTAKLSPDKPLMLMVSIKQDNLVVMDSGTIISIIPKDKGEYNISELSDILNKIKAQFPKEENVTIMSESHIPYDTLIQVMDACRVYETKVDGKKTRTSLFPNISIGEVEK